MDSKTKRKFKMWQLLENGREQLGISKRELYRGIQINLKHHVSDQIADSFDKLTWDYLLGRMGISNLIFEGYIHAYEFDLYQLHERLRETTNKILQMRYQRDWGHAQHLNTEELPELIQSVRADIKQYQDILYGETAYDSTAVQLHAFFLKKVEGYLLMGEELLENTSKVEERKTLVQEAWALFHDGDCLKTATFQLSKHFLAPAELECLLQAAGVLKDAGQFREAEVLLQKLWSYRFHHEQDLDEEVKIYPYAAWMLAIIKRDLDHEGATALLEQGMELLIRSGRMNSLAMLMEALINAPDYTGDRELLRQQLDALKDLAGIAKANIYGIYPLFSIENMIHVNDLIKQKRLNLGKTQQDLAEGVTSVERYSKFECERYKLSWDKIAVFLMELDQPYEKQWPILDTNQPEVMRAYVRCRRYIRKNQYELMDDQFQKMKPLMDQKCAVNQQYVAHIEGIIDEEIYAKEYPGRSAVAYKEVLNLTVPKFPDIRFNDMTLGEMELRLILDYLFALNDGTNIAHIMKKILEGFDTRKVSSIYWSGIQRSIRENNRVFMGLFQGYIVSANMAKNNMRNAVKQGELQGVYRGTYGYASDIEQEYCSTLKVKKTCEYCYSHAFILAKFDKSTYWIRVINEKMNQSLRVGSI